MGYARVLAKNTFAEVIEKIRTLTESQQRFLSEMLSNHERVISTFEKKRLLKKSFGIWANRKDIKDSVEYVNEIRSGWGSRIERINK